MTLDMGSVRGGCDVVVMRRRVAENVPGAGGIPPPATVSVLGAAASGRGSFTLHMLEIDDMSQCVMFVCCV